jgi:hypothetical protein
VRALCCTNGAASPQHERAQFIDTLKKAKASNKAREVYMGVFMKRLANRSPLHSWYVSFTLMIGLF